MVTSSIYSIQKAIKYVAFLFVLIVLCYLFSHKSSDNVIKNYREDPLIIIGGFARSGTTLARSLLDSHPLVRCGQETLIVQFILQQMDNYGTGKVVSQWLNEAGVTRDLIDDATASFIYEIIKRHGEDAPRLCNKDPFTMLNTVYFARLFPNAKFVFMIRDGRASTHSLITRKIFTGDDEDTNFDWAIKLEHWNRDIEIMWKQCIRVGEERCLPVYYELLVLKPKEQLERILKFLGLPWSDNVLHHQDFVNTKTGIALSELEPSTSQVVKPLYVDSLYSWVGHIPEEVTRNLSNIAPMLEKLGYDMYMKQTSYGIPDEDIMKAYMKIERDLLSKETADISNIDKNVTDHDDIDDLSSMVIPKPNEDDHFTTDAKLIVYSEEKDNNEEISKSNKNLGVLAKKILQTTFSNYQWA